MADPNTKERELRSLVKAMGELNAYTKGAVVVPENRFDAFKRKAGELERDDLVRAVRRRARYTSDNPPGCAGLAATSRADHNDAARARSRRSIRQTRRLIPTLVFVTCHLSLHNPNRKL